MKIYQSKAKWARQQCFTEALAEFKASGKGKQEKSRAMTKTMSELKLNASLQKSNAQKYMPRFMKVATRAAKAEKMVVESTDTFGKIVQERQWAVVTPGQRMLVDDNGPSSSSDGVMAPSGFSDGGRHDFVLLKEPEVVVVGPNSGEDPAIARRRNEAAGDAKELVRAALDYEAEAFRKNRDSFTKTADPRGMRKAVSYEDRLLVDEVTEEVYPGRKRHISLYGRIWYTPHTNQVLTTKITQHINCSVECLL